MKLNKQVILGIFLFIIVIGSCIIQLSQSIRLDEAQQIWASTKSITGILAYIGQDVHVPLYALILHFWIQIFGTSIISARIPSIIFFLLTLPALYTLYKEASNKKVAFIAVAGFALSPFILWYSSEARMYTLFTFVATVNMIYFLRIVRTNGAEGKFGYFLSSIFGLYTHYFFIFSLFTQAVFVISRMVYYWYQEKSHPSSIIYGIARVQRRTVFLTIGLMSLAFLFLTPWLWYVYRLGSLNNTQPVITPPTTFNIFLSVTNFIFGFQSQTIQSAIISFWPLIVIAFFFVFTRKKILRAKFIEFFLLSAFLPLLTVYAISFFRPIFLSRYLIFTIPSIFFLLAWGILNYTSRLQKIILTGFFVILMFCLMYQDYSPTISVKEDYSQVATYLSSHATSSDIIAVTPPFTIYPLEYSYTGEARISSIPLWDVYSKGPIPPFSLLSLQKQLQDFSQIYTYLYIVTSYDQGYQQKIVNYMETHYHRIAKKTFSPGLEVRTYQLRYLPSA